MQALSCVEAADYRVAGVITTGCYAVGVHAQKPLEWIPQSGDGAEGIIMEPYNIRDTEHLPYNKAHQSVREGFAAVYYVGPPPRYFDDTGEEKGERERQFRRSHGRCGTQKRDANALYAVARCPVEYATPIHPSRHHA